jgi:hypothetical protein
MSIIEHAKTELAAVNFGEEDTAVMVGILEKFLDQWDSGGAVHVASQVFARLLSGQPLSPLTGEDDEWFDPMGDGIMLQNKRCGSVFKDWRMPDGSLASKAGEGELLCHDIDHPKGSGVRIVFPYDPITKMVPEPLMTFTPTMCDGKNG